MSPELKAFIYSMKASTADDSRAQTGPAHNLLRTIAGKTAWLFTLIANALQEMGPYACELRPVGQFKSAVGKCGTRGDVIGHHGLA
jgi:hypothetical protein